MVKDSKGLSLNILSCDLIQKYIAMNDTLRENTNYKIEEDHLMEKIQFFSHLSPKNKLYFKESIAIHV